MDDAPPPPASAAGRTRRVVRTPDSADDALGAPAAPTATPPSPPGSSARRPSATAASSGSTTPDVTARGARRPRRGPLSTRRRRCRADDPGRRPPSSARRRRPTWPGATSPRRGSVRAGPAGRDRCLSRGGSSRPARGPAEIATRLGWLTKETGDTAGVAPLLRQGSRRRAARVGHDGHHRRDGHRVAVGAALDRGPVPVRGARSSTRRPSPRASTGGSGRSPCSTAARSTSLFNMYALYLAGPIVERWYGSIRFLLIYLACAAAGSVASFVFGGDAPSVGASGAIFGLFGILLAAGRVHHPVDRQSRALVGQLGMLILINIVFGFAVTGHRQRRPPRWPGGRPVARRDRPADARPDDVVAVAAARRGRGQRTSREVPRRRSSRSRVGRLRGRRASWADRRDRPAHMNRAISGTPG